MKLLLTLVLGCVTSAAPAADKPVVTANATNSFTIVGMHCDGCAGGLAAELKQTPGVASAQVTFSNKLAVVAIDTNKVSSAQLTKVIKSEERPFMSPPAPPVEIVPMSELGELGVRRYELSSAAHAAQAQHASQRLLQSQSKKARPILVSLRHPRAAKQAFAVSLVFGPPKGLEL